MTRLFGAATASIIFILAIFLGCENGGGSYKDTTPPETDINSSPPNPSSSTSATFAFASSEKESTFQCQIDGGSWKNCPSPMNYTGLSYTSHTFSVRATDAAGNTDPTPASYTWTIVDIVPPGTSITFFPPNPSNRTSPRFFFISSEAGSTFQCQLDGGGWGVCTSPIDYSGLSETMHTFSVRAIDAAGNTDLTPASYTWRIDITPPDTSLTGFPTNPTNITSTTFTFSSSEAGSTFQCQLDGGGWIGCTSPRTYTGLSEGSHTFEARAVDAAWNVDGSPAKYTWTVSLIRFARTYGGGGRDYASSVQQTSDGGHIVAGKTGSFGAGAGDAWVLKLNADGAVSWQKAYGGWNADEVSSVRQTSDGGYIVAGTTYSFGAGNGDVWVLKLNVNGGVAWEKAYGGTFKDSGTSIQQTTDGGYIVAGLTSSFGAGWDDLWVMKLDVNGNITWQKAYGGTLWDGASSIQQTNDGGYIVTGWYSLGTGNSDLWALKLSADGTVVWEKAYGGGAIDDAFSIQQTSDGGYIVAGETGSFGSGNNDLWAMKLSSDGIVIWEKAYGDIWDDWASSIQQTNDGGYIVAGWTDSFGSGLYDVWVIELSAEGAIVWQKAYGGTGGDGASSIRQTRDGGYIVAGQTGSFGAGGNDFWVLKLWPDGSVPPLGTDTAASIVNTSAIVTTTTATTTDTTAAPISTTATVTDTYATIGQQAP